jgi:hypothetical protein
VQDIFICEHSLNKGKSEFLHRLKESWIEPSSLQFVPVFFKKCVGYIYIYILYIVVSVT